MWMEKICVKIKIFLFFIHFTMKIPNELIEVFHTLCDDGLFKNTL